VAAPGRRLGDLIAKRSCIAVNGWIICGLVVKGHGESFVFVAAEDGERK